MKKALFVAISACVVLATLTSDKYHKSGDYFGSNIENTFTLKPESNITVGTKIDFVIP